MELVSDKMERIAVRATPKARKLAKENGTDLSHITPSGRHGEITADDVISFRKTAATPLALRIAKEKKIDISCLRGSGYRGKVYSCDLAKIPTTVPEPSAETRQGRGSPPEKRVRMSSMRKAIAAAMSASHANIPQVTQNTEVDVTAFNAFRKKLNEMLDKEKRISVNDMILKAAGVALREHERFRYELSGNEYFANEYIVHDEVNIGIAVALDDGLIVPVLRGADKLSLSEIAAGSKHLAAAARSGKLSQDELTGGVFTVTNLGMYGVHSFTPIINIPEAAILGVGVQIERPVIEGTSISAHSFLMLSLTYDHRILNGAEAASFSSRVKYLLENPAELIKNNGDNNG